MISGKILPIRSLATSPPHKVHKGERKTDGVAADHKAADKVDDAQSLGREAAFQKACHSSEPQKPFA